MCSKGRGSKVSSLTDAYNMTEEWHLFPTSHTKRLEIWSVSVITYHVILLLEVDTMELISSEIIWKKVRPNIADARSNKA